MPGERRVSRRRKPPVPAYRPPDAIAHRADCSPPGPPGDLTDGASRKAIAGGPAHDETPDPPLGRRSASLPFAAAGALAGRDALDDRDDQQRQAHREQILAPADRGEAEHRGNGGDLKHGGGQRQGAQHGQPEHLVLPGQGEDAAAL